MNSGHDDLIPEVSQQGKPLPPIQDAVEFFASDIEMPAVLIEGLLHKGSKLVVGGGSKSMKTWTLLDMAICIATGTEWWGRRTTEGKVLFVNLEVQAAFFRDRMQAILSARELALNPDEFDILNLRGHAADAEQLLPKIAAHARGRNYVLIVLDPIYKCLGGRDENKAGDIAALMNALEQLAVDTGAAVAFGAHFSKGNQSAKESIDRIGGSGVFARDPDSILVMTPHEREDAFAVHATLRNFKAAKAFCVVWKYPLMTMDNELDPTRLRKPGNSSGRRAPDPDQMLKMFPTKGWAKDPRSALLNTKQLEELFDEQGFDPETVPKVRDHLEAEGEIRVLRKQEGNQTLAGLPAAVTAYEKSKAREGGARRAEK